MATSLFLDSCMLWENIALKARNRGYKQTTIINNHFLVHPGPLTGGNTSNKVMGPWAIRDPQRISRGARKVCRMQKREKMPGKKGGKKKKKREEKGKVKKKREQSRYLVTGSQCPEVF